MLLKFSVLASVQVLVVKPSNALFEVHDGHGGRRVVIREWLVYLTRGRAASTGGHLTVFLAFLEHFQKT